MGDRPGTLVEVSTGDPGSPSERIGSTLLGKWTLEKLLGEGGMASVYVARHKIGRLEAIKIMHPFVASSPELRARFEQEARLANRFHHSGAVEIRDIDTTEDGAPFLVMELLEGETLSALARRSKEPLDVATVLKVADAVLDVLAAAHASGIIHRDIKPDNLLLTKDGQVKVLDFGIARLREGLSRDVKTSTGTTLGTVAYMAPEQAKGGDIDARADLYAMGATMFRLLAGRRVHEADTEAERLEKLMSGDAEPLATVAPRVPGAVCAIVDRALAFDRTKRYPDAAAMQADVRAAAGGQTSAPRALPDTAAPASAAAPEREATTRIERLAPDDEATKRESPSPQDDVATVATQAPRSPPEVLRTERMPNAPARAAATPAAPAARIAAAPRAGAALLAPHNRVFLLLLVGGGLALVLLLVATVVVALRQRPDADPSASPAASDSAVPSALASPATPAATETASTSLPSHAAPHPPASPKGKGRGR